MRDESFEPKIVYDWTIFVKYKQKCYRAHFVYFFELNKTYSCEDDIIMSCTEDINIQDDMSSLTLIWYLKQSDEDDPVNPPHLCYWIVLSGRYICFITSSVDEDETFLVIYG